MFIFGFVVPMVRASPGPYFSENPEDPEGPKDPEDPEDPKDPKDPGDPEDNRRR